MFLLSYQKTGRALFEKWPASALETRRIAAFS
jgi:hypothetical protein